MTEELKKATKDKIFREAAELFSRDGYHKVSVREICEAAGVTKPVLYYYFNDKENLLCELMKETRQIVERVIGKYVQPDMKFVEKLEGIINFYVQFLNEYPYLMKFLTFIQLMSAPEKVKQFKHNKAKEDWERIFEIFEEAQKNGELHAQFSHKILAQNFIGSIIIILSNYLMGHITQLDFEGELNAHLEFWKQQFVIDKN